MAAGAMLSMPESPVYLLKKGREEEAARSLQWLRGAGYDVTEELQEVNKSLIVLRFFQCSPATTICTSLQMKSDIQHQTGVGSISLADLALKAKYRGAIQ